MKAGAGDREGLSHNPRSAAPYSRACGLTEPMRGADEGQGEGDGVSHNPNRAAVRGDGGDGGAGVSQRPRSAAGLAAASGVWSDGGEIGAWGLTGSCWGCAPSLCMKKEDIKNETGSANLFQA